MVAKVYSATLLGLNCLPIEIEVDYRHGLAHFVIVGLGDKAVQEAKERIISAIRNSGAEYIPKRVIVNLAPADLPKTGPVFDLGIAVGYLVASEQLEIDFSHTAFLGELALDGAVRPLQGVLPMLFGLRKLGFSKVFVPSGNYTEAARVSDLDIVPVAALSEFLDICLRRAPPIYPTIAVDEPAPATVVEDFANVAGQMHAKRALEIAAAGGHNILLSGVPGAGKTMLAKAFPGILPSLSEDQIIELAQVYSVAGLASSFTFNHSTPPFRAPHHTISHVGLLGGGAKPRPGEISLAHHGVLFMDEFTEFAPPSLEGLRQPLEDGLVNITRANYAVSYPANFQLLAAMNPCRCGHLGDPDSPCVCSSSDIIRYKRRLSGPILDRIDILVKVNKIDYSALASMQPAEPSIQIRQRVLSSREIQAARYARLSLKTNAAATSRLAKELFSIEPAAYSFLVGAARKYHISARSFFKLAKVARTIADLESRTSVGVDQVAEAITLRGDIY